MKLPIVNGMPAHNMTQSHATLVRPNTSPSTATPFPLPPQSGWGAGDIGTLVFGCIASVLGVLTLWAAYWQGCRRALRVVGNGESLGVGNTRNGTLSLERIVLESIVLERIVLEREPWAILYGHALETTKNVLQT